MDESPASDRRRFSDLWRKRDEPAERAVAQTLSRVDVDQHVPGRGTLLTEPLIVAHGEHRDDFDLFAADARPLGAAIHGNERDYELRDMSDHLVWRLQRRSRASGSGLKWRYELAWGDEPPITLKRSSRVTNTAEATRADRRRLGVDIDPARWRGRPYQTANRLAHLYWLNEVVGVRAWLVHLLFVNDRRSPTSADQWSSAICDADAELGLRGPVERAGHVLLDAGDRDELILDG